MTNQSYCSLSVKSDWNCVVGSSAKRREPHVSRIAGAIHAVKKIGNNTRILIGACEWREKIILEEAYWKEKGRNYSHRSKLPTSYIQVLFTFSIEKTRGSWMELEDKENAS